VIALAAFAAGKASAPAGAAPAGKAAAPGEYHFVDPLVTTGKDVMPRLTNEDVRKLKEEYAAASAASTAQGDITTAGIYFRELHDGGVASENASAKFVPRSLLKVPLVMALLHEVEEGQLSLPPLIKFGGGANEDVVQDYQPREKLVVGQTYAPEELMRYTLEYSENNAALLLSQIIGLDAARETYTQLGIEAPTSDTYTMSVQTYASFFRILFNASYLSPQHSEQVLAYLTDTDFDHGIVAGVPTTITVSHKFGELETPEGVRQLHDCGIVYAPLNPYVLCVMTQGKDFKKLERFLQEISKLTYARVTGS
jgi:beta-lactamase class A